MSNDETKIAKQDDPSREDAKTTADAADGAKGRAKTEELEEGLDESFPGSDAPTSTRRSSANERSSKKANEGDPSEQPS